MRLLTAYFLRDALGGKRVLLIGGLVLAGTVFFVLSARPADAFATRIIDAEVYARDYLFASVYFLRFTSLFLIVTVASGLFCGRCDHPLLARTSRRRLFFAKAAALVLSGAFYVLLSYSLLLGVYAASPFRHALGFPAGTGAALVVHVAHASLLSMLAGLTVKRAGIYLVVLPGYLFADLLSDYPLDPAATGPVTFVANAFFANIHQLSDGGFTFLASPFFMILFAAVLLLAAFFIHESLDL